MLTNALLVGGLTLVAGLVAAAALRMLPSVRLQLAGLALVAVALPTTAILLSGAVMFHMGAKGELIAISAVAAVASVVGALALGRAIARRIEEVRRTSTLLAAGELSERAPVEGPIELAELAASFNAMADHVESVLGARRELVAWASHDLRAPLTSIRAILEAIDDGVVEAADYLPTLHGHVRTLAALVEDLFELACIDAGSEALATEPVDLAALADECVGRFAVEALARRTALQAVVRDRPATAACDRRAVDRVVTNLVVNALRYTPSGGRITVSVGLGAGSVLLSVEDTGIGIPPEAVDRVFEPFFRVDPSRDTRQGGGGLGLAIARGLIEAQRGKIWAEQPAGGGTRICVSLPASDLTDRPAAADPSPTATAVSPDYERWPEDVRPD